MNPVTLSFVEYTLLILLFICCRIIPAGAQDSLVLLNDFSPYKCRIDSIKLRPEFKKPVIHIPAKVNGLTFNGGCVSYNWNYRSDTDTPFHENNISQHLVTGRMNFTVGRSIPLTVTYLESRSNSSLFNNFRDVRIEFNAAEFKRLQSVKLTEYLENQTNKIRDPFLKPFIDCNEEQLNKLSGWLNRETIISRLVHYRKILLNTIEIDSLHINKDSLLAKAKAFIVLYDSLQHKHTQLQTLRDSLQQEYIKKEKQIAQVKQLLTNPTLPKEAIDSVLEQNGINDGRLNRLLGFFNSVKKFAIGRTMPSYSNLTLNNINVNGIDVEYNDGIYLAFAAGVVDFRSRDFFYNTNNGRQPQFVVSGRVGYGSKEGSHIILTAFRGKKQLSPGNNLVRAAQIYGLSLEAQMVLDKYTTLTGEIAQSAGPAISNGAGDPEKSSFNLKDNKNKAYSLKLKSFIPQTQTGIEGAYQYRGIAFQSFSNYFNNAASDGWYIKANQHLWKKYIQVAISVGKNAYANPYILTHYSGETIFKTARISFNKYKWPSLSFGYMPSSQLAVLDGQVYENYYQALNLTAGYRYKAGTSLAYSLIAYNRFYNGSQDSALVYYNARNFYLNQQFMFRYYSADIAVSQTVNVDYTLNILEAGATANVLPQQALGFGVKVNQLNTDIKVGLFGTLRFTVLKNSELSARIEKVYLPGSGGRLFKNEFYNIGLNHCFK